MLFDIIILLAAAGITSALSIYSEPDGHHWRPATKHDSRSPCPGINALANHGWLPRSGKNITLANIQYAVSEGYNFEKHALDSVFKMVQDFNLTTTGDINSFNLEDVKKHDAIEFDGSLSRDDYYFGDALHFNPYIWSTTAKAMKLYEIGWTLESRLVTVELAAKARAARVSEAMQRNPQFNASQAEQAGTYGTSALYLLTLWDDNINATHKSWVRSFFEQERIPYFEGFKKPEKLKTGQRLSDMITALQAVKV